MNDFISTEPANCFSLRFLRAKIVINQNTSMKFLHKMNKTPIIKAMSLFFSNY